ncbi:MAG: HlyD family type I secretion periplasmic adaptor subunit [Quisquiliibacterium sp.]
MAELNQKGFEAIGRAVHLSARPSRSLFGRMLDRMTATRDHATDWTTDADWAQLMQEPLRARRLLRLALLLIVALVLWASVAEIDIRTQGEARVVPTSQVQIVQSVDGGIVEEILVREGASVQPGQLLAKVDPTRFESSLGESRASQVALRVKALRLQALTRGEAFNVPEDLRRESPQIVAQEQKLHDSRKDELRAQLAVAENQLAQRFQELNEVRARRTQAERGLELALKELSATRPMVATGAVSEVEVLRLEREVARLRGDRDQSIAQISRVQAAIAEAQRRIDEVKLTARNQMSAELSDTLGKLSAMSESRRTLEDKVIKAEIRSPVRGTVKRLLVNTVGAVVQPGKEMFEIVPTDDALILEVRVSPRDIAFLHPNQPAMVKFTAYDYAIYGGLEAEVVNIGADSVIDEKGNAFFIVRVRTGKVSLGPDLPIIPGMVAQVDILTGKRTVLQYLLKPVLRAKANALSER